MSVEFEKVRIADLGKVVTGKTPPTAREEYFGTDYPFITPTDIDGSKRHVETERYLSQESKKDFNNYLLPSGAICFVCIGATIGKICMTNVPSFTNQQINSVIVDGKRHDNCFVYYLLSTKKEHIKNIAGGAATPIVSKSTFSDVFVEIPELIVQKKIAAILSAYDDLIENNLRRIKILEEMAQTLYREWFVNFRFPGHQKVKMVNSPLGKIPEGWRIDPLGNMTSVITKGTTATTLGKEFTENGINFIKVESIEESGALLENKFAKIDAETHQLLGRSQLCVDDILFSIAGAIGRVTIIPERILPANTNQALAIIRPSIPKLVSYLFWGLRSSDFLNFSLGRVVQTAQANVSLSVLKSAPVIVPPDDILAQFNGMIDPIRKFIEVISAKNINLRQTRDLLLPKLISGELDVSELDIKTADERL